jgi:hypothetical protein
MASGSEMLIGKVFFSMIRGTGGLFAATTARATCSCIAGTSRTRSSYKRISAFPSTLSLTLNAASREPMACGCSDMPNGTVNNYQTDETVTNLLLKTKCWRQEAARFAGVRGKGLS